MQIFINTYGTYVHVKDEMFEIRLRSEPKEKVTINHLAVHKVSSIVMSKGAAISTDAIALAMKNNIDIVVVENNGHPIGRFWHSKLGSTTKIRKRQLEASLNEVGVMYVKEWLMKKLENQADYLQDLSKHRAPLQEFLITKQEAILTFREKMSQAEAQQVNDIADSLRGWEGSAGRNYFGALGKSIAKDFEFAGRSFRPAQDPFNAMLNYCYGILYSRVEKALMLAGLDPYIGFMHRDDYNQKSLVYDFIEPYRIYAERAVFTLFSKKKVNKSFFTEITGGISLNAEGKPLLVQHFTEYLDLDQIRYKGRQQTRYNALQMDAHAFANALIKN